MSEVIAPVGLDRLAECLRIRHSVFVIGQNVPEAEEVDGRDPDCLHYLVTQTGTPVATARVLPLNGIGKVQRVAVLETARSGGIGSKLMRFILKDLQQTHGFSQAKLGSQTHAIGFYEKLGFKAFGPEFDDAGIPHREMSIDLA
ncbi:MAG: GNAT family N-acetyltransferase [Pseudomonadota bacterium]